MSGINLAGEKAELRFMVEITRAATGVVEQYEMVGHASPEELQQLLGADHGSDTHNSNP
jgi:hypothetical protein